MTQDRLAGQLKFGNAATSSVLIIACLSLNMVTIRVKSVVVETGTQASWCSSCSLGNFIVSFVGFV